jgi:hypothetical protein
VVEPIHAECRQATTSFKLGVLPSYPAARYAIVQFIRGRTGQNTGVGKGTFATHWVASAPFLAEPYKGSDTYITKDGLMQAMVTTFDGAALKMKK